MTLCSTIADKHTPKAFCGCASRNRDPDGHSGRHTVGYRRKSDEGGQVKDEDWHWRDLFYHQLDRRDCAFRALQRQGSAQQRRDRADVAASRSWRECSGEFTRSMLTGPMSFCHMFFKVHMYGCAFQCFMTYKVIFRTFRNVFCHYKTLNVFGS